MEDIKEMVDDILLDMQTAQICIGDASNKILELINKERRIYEYKIKYYPFELSNSQLNVLQKNGWELDKKVVMLKEDSETYFYHLKRLD